MQRFVFLDIDGVLNSAQTAIDKRKEINQSDWPASYQNYFSRVAFDIPSPNKLQDLNWLHNHFLPEEVHYVLTSTWRLCTPLRDIRMLFYASGFTGMLTYMTPVLRGRMRGGEIRQFLWRAVLPQDEYSFVIIDDESDMGPLADRLIQVDNQIGLEPWHVSAAIAMLSKPVEKKTWVSE